MDEKELNSYLKDLNKRIDDNYKNLNGKIEYDHETLSRFIGKLIKDVHLIKHKLGLITIRGTKEKPCENCNNSETGSFLENGFDRCNSCGFPTK